MNRTTENAGMSSKIGTLVGRDWTKGNTFSNLLVFSWPLIINNILTNIGPLTDMIWVGKLGSASLAGVGVAYLLVTLLDAFKSGLDMGTRAMIARFVGAGDSRGANHAALQGYVVTIGFAAIVGTLGALLAGPILRMMGLTPEVVAQGAPYLRIQFFGILTMGLVRQNEGTMQYSGDTINPMKIAAIFRVFHIVLCPFLVFGWWIFPRLETSGAAYTGIISACLGAALGLWYLLSGHTRLKLSFRNFRPDVKMIWRIMKIGVPVSITSIERSFGLIILTWLITPFGTLATAAHTAALQVTQLINIVAWGLGQAAAVLAGQNLGAKQPERAEKSSWLGVILLTTFMVISSLVVLFWGKDIIGIFNNEPNVLEVGKAFLRIQIITYLFFGCASVLQNCLNGVGDTLITMVVTLLGMFGAQLPLAYFLSRHTSLGVYGTYWAIAISTVLMAGIYATYFRLGRWKQKKI
jgi:putative MATE family efflux protein